jgi:hypothetical protein
MKHERIEKVEDVDPGLFSPEELEMMKGAEGIVEELELPHDATELQRQYQALARMVAEGGERERQLRALVNELTLLAQSADQQRSYHEQTQNLARIVLASSERELHLQQCLEAVRNVALNRVRNVI